LLATSLIQNRLDPGNVTPDAPQTCAVAQLASRVLQAEMKQIFG
jgi:hypothetical protein